MSSQAHNPYDVINYQDLSSVGDFKILEKYIINSIANKNKLDLRIIWLKHQLPHFLVEV